MLKKLLDYVSLNNKRKVDLGGFGRRVVGIYLKGPRKTRGFSGGTFSLCDSCDIRSSKLVR
jgi:hypothetical protein